MAVLGNTFPTLVEVTKRLDPFGRISSIAEILNKYLPILDDMAWEEGNLPTGHRYTARTGLPSLTWRRFNQGVVPTKSTTDQFDEPCGMLEGYSKVDVDLAALNGNEQAFRMSEDIAFIQNMNIQVATALFYASILSTPEQITGLQPRLNVFAANTDPSKNQIILADPSASGANQTSVWLVGWSPETVFGIFPKGSIAGLTTEDLGRQLVYDGVGTPGNQFLAYVTRWQWKLGLCVRDYRYLARICNIDTTRWRNNLSQGADIAMRMHDAIAAIFNLNVVNPVFYMSRATFNMLNQQLAYRQANWLEYVDGPEGTGGVRRRIPSFYGIPIKYVDALTATEAVVV